MCLYLCAARISNSVFPSAPPVRKLEDGSSFICLEQVPLQEDWNGYGNTLEQGTSSTVTGNVCS